jgi:dTDP-glucose pyrophosphorylase
MRRTDWSRLRVGPDATVRETLAVIDRGKAGIALVTDPHDRLLGTVTDGDVRRGILANRSLDGPVSTVMFTRFVGLPAGATDAEALDVMQAHQVRQVPLLESDGRVVGIVCLDELLPAANARPNWVVVMAGGEGRRLRPLTDDRPKPMLLVGDQPLLEITVRRLASQGLRRIFLAVHYQRDKIEDHFGDGTALGCQIEYIREPVPLDTGGALGLLPEMPSHPLLVVNGDVVTDVDFAALLDHHRQHGGAATVSVRPFSQQIPYGVVRCVGERIEGIEEKPVQHSFINAGIYVIEPRLVALVPPGERYALTQLVEDALAAGEKVVPFVIHERWVDIGQPHDYQSVRDGVD